MNPFKKIIQASCSILPAGLLTKTSGINVLLPYHHVVSDEDLPHIQELYRYKNRKQFINDLEWLLKKFKPIHPNDLAETIFNDKPRAKKSFLFSFDDGFREVYDIIAPILIEKGVPAIFFINPAFIDNKELFYRCKLSLVLSKIKTHNQLRKAVSRYLECEHLNYKYLKNRVLQIQYPDRSRADELGRIAEIDFENFLLNRQPFLTSEQIKELKEHGFAFGGHGIDHPDYKFLNINEQYHQTIASIEFINQPKANRFDYFAFPHEDCEVEQEFFDRMNRADRPVLFFGLQNQRPENQNHILHRFNAERPREKMQALVKTILTYNSFLRLVNRQNITRK